MKTSKPPAAASDAGPNRRQPLRRTRTNPPRFPAPTSRTARDRETAAATQEQQIDIFPGVTHFADAITALPKELVKHFTLLKEVDAKINVPQQSLFQLIHMALDQPVPNTTRSTYDGFTSTSAPGSVAMTAQNSSAGSGTAVAAHSFGPSTSGDLALTNGSAFDESNLPRRQLFRKVAIEIKDMLVALEEKNHVISTANDVLNKQLGRIDDIWPHLEKEFSEEAKWGSNTHWAYPENRTTSRSANNAQAERSRREGAASLAAAAQQIAEEAAARSDARKQAVAVRRSQKQQQSNAHQDSDADDHQKLETKKSGGTKSRKSAADREASAAGSAGLGISGALPGLAKGVATSSSKRRKVEKPAAGGSVAMERALSGVYASNGGKTKTASPRESPVPDAAAKKRKALPAGGNAAKKSRNGASAASSPVIGTFPDNIHPSLALPPPSAPTSSVLAAPSVADNAAKGLGHDTSAQDNNSAASIVKRLAEKPTDRPAEPASGSEVIAHPHASGDGNMGVHDSSVAAASAHGNSAPQNNTANHTEPVTSRTMTAKTSTFVANADSPGTNGVGRTAGASSGAESPSNDASLVTEPPAAGAGTAGTYPPYTASLKEQSDAQRKADDDDHPISERLTERTTNVSGAASEDAASISSTTDAKAAQTPADKPNKEAPTSMAAETPVPVHVPASVDAVVPFSESTKAAETAIPAPALGSRNPAKVAALKSETSESSPPMVAMTMTRTRSAGGHNHDAKRDAVSSLFSDANGKLDEVTTKKEAMVSNSSAMAVQPPPVTTKSGRASKPSAPALATLADALALASSPSTTSRSRPARAGEPFSNGHGSSGSGSGTAKRSHKKGASSVSSQAARDRDYSYAHGHHHSVSDVGNSSSGRSHQTQQTQQNQQHRKHGAEEEEDEPLYCYCERVSFGEMIACDSDDCKREWFHLECVGLRVAPKTNVKWYCEDCKRRIKNGDRKSGVR